MKVALALAASLGFGLVMSSCSSGPSATETAACNAILRITLPPGLGRPTEGSETGIALPANLNKNLIDSGDPTLTRYGRAIESSSGNDFVKAFEGARQNVEGLGPNEPSPIRRSGTPRDSPSAHLAAEEGRDSVRRWALVVAGLLLTERTAITAEPRAAHHLPRERETYSASSGSRSVGCPVAMARSQACTRRSLVRNSMNAAPGSSPMGN